MNRRFTGKPVFKGKDLKELVERNKAGKISFRSKVWSNYSKEAKKIIKKMLYRDPGKRIALLDIFNEKWVLKNRKIRTELTFQTTMASKGKIDESQNELAGNSSNSNFGSMKNFSSFKRTFIRRSMNKSRTEIIYSKNLKSTIEKASFQDDDFDECVQNEGEVNHSRYSLEPKFIGFRLSKQSLMVLPPVLPSFLDNYSVSILPNNHYIIFLQVNSFLIYSRSELCSGSSFNNTSEDLKNRSQMSNQKKSSIDSSFAPENRTHDSFEEFLQKHRDSQIFETQREEIESHNLLSSGRRNPMDSRSDQDLDLTLVVPGMKLTPFKTKMF